MTTSINYVAIGMVISLVTASALSLDSRCGRSSENEKYTIFY